MSAPINIFKAGTRNITIAKPVSRTGINLDILDTNTGTTVCSDVPEEVAHALADWIKENVPTPKPALNLNNPAVNDMENNRWGRLDSTSDGYAGPTGQAAYWIEALTEYENLDLLPEFKSYLRDRGITPTKTITYSLED
jgi:hypothetical protein